MNAPRPQVMEKVLSAHSTRSLRMIHQFKQSLVQSNSSVTSQSEDSSATTAIESVIKDLNDISNARTFHQSLIVGLLEACKGLLELYVNNYNLPTSPSEQATLSVEEDQEIVEKNHAIAYEQLKKILRKIMREYNSVMTQAFSMFFNRFHDHFLSVNIEYDVVTERQLSMQNSNQNSFLNSSEAADANDNSFSKNENDNQDDNNDKEDDLDKDFVFKRKSIVTDDSSAGASESGSDSDDSYSSDENHSEEENNNGDDNIDEDAKTFEEEVQQVSKEEELLRLQQFKSSELREELNSWIMLARQAIMDVMYLDRSENDCADTLSRKNRNAIDNHARPFSDIIIDSFQKHLNVLFTHRMKCFMSSIEKIFPTFLELCQLENNNFSIETDIFAVKKVLKERTIEVKKMYDLIISNAMQLFEDICRDSKPLVDIYEVTNQDNHILITLLITKFCNLLSHGIETICGIVNHKLLYDDSGEMLYRYGSNSMELIRENNSYEDNDEVDEIYSELDPILEPSLESTNNPFSSQNSYFKGPLLIFSSGLLRQLAPDLMEKLQDVLMSSDLPEIRNDRTLQVFIP